MPEEGRKNLTANHPAYVTEGMNQNGALKA